MGKQCENSIWDYTNYCNKRGLKFEELEIETNRAGTYIEGLLFGISLVVKESSYHFNRCPIDLHEKLDAYLDRLKKKIEKGKISYDKKHTDNWHMGVAHSYTTTASYLEILYRNYFRMGGFKKKMRQWAIQLSNQASNEPENYQISIRDNKAYDGKFEAEVVRLPNGIVRIKIFRIIKESIFGKKMEQKFTFLIDSNVVTDEVFY